MKWEHAFKGIVALLVFVVIGVFALEWKKDSIQQFFTHPEKSCTLSGSVAGFFDVLNTPLGAQHKKEVVWRATTPEGFHAVLPLLQVVSVVPCMWQSQEQATVVLRAIRLIEHNPETGTERIMIEVNDFSSYDKPLFVGRLFERVPRWYAAPAHVTDPLFENVAIRTDKELAIDIARVPQHIFHGWTEPQVEALPGMNYAVEVEAKITGMARLQIGIDYWRSIGAEDIGWKEDCKETNHCEGYLSDWFGPSPEREWQTLRAPHSF